MTLAVYLYTCIWLAIYVETNIQEGPSYLVDNSTGMPVYKYLAWWWKIFSYLPSNHSERVGTANRHLLLPQRVASNFQLRYRDLTGMKLPHRT